MHHIIIMFNVFCIAPDEEPVYVYDYRGLRVRADSTSKVQDSTTSTLTTPQSKATKPRPKSASAAISNSSTGKWMCADYTAMTLLKQNFKFLRFVV